MAADDTIVGSRPYCSTLDWIEDPELRRNTGRELNKGESRNSLARAVFFHRRGAIRDCTFENQQHRASGLNLLITAITRWEHPLSEPRDRRDARGGGRPRSSSLPPVTARLGARQSHRRPRLVVRIREAFRYFRPSFLDLRSDTRPLIRIFRGMNSE
jgi:hypothetical protein